LFLELRWTNLHYAIFLSGSPGTNLHYAILLSGSPGTKMHYAIFLSGSPGTKMHYAIFLSGSPGTKMHYAIFLSGSPGTKMHYAILLSGSPGTKMHYAITSLGVVSRLRRVKSKALPCKTQKRRDALRLYYLLNTPYVICFVFGDHFILFILFLNFEFCKAIALLIMRCSLDTTPS
jgi:hypothetical protein